MTAETKILAVATVRSVNGEAPIISLRHAPWPNGDHLLYSEQQMAAQAAEIEALRAGVDTAKGQAEFYRTERNKNQRKAERLAEAGRRVTDAFRAHGRAHWSDEKTTRAECEAAMTAFDALLRDQEGPTREAGSG